MATAYQLHASGPAIRDSAASNSADIGDAFRDIVERHSTFAYNVAFRMLRNEADAEDAVQDAFISAYRAYPRFKGGSKVSTWLYRIVVNSCLMKIRKDKSRASKLVAQEGYEDAPAIDMGADPERSAVNSDLRDAIAAGLQALSPDLRAAVILRDVQGLSSEEAAAVLNIAVPSLKSRLHRARLRLRKHLNGYLGPSADTLVAA